MIVEPDVDFLPDRSRLANATPLDEDLLPSMSLLWTSTTRVPDDPSTTTRGLLIRRSRMPSWPENDTEPPKLARPLPRSVLNEPLPPLHANAEPESCTPLVETEPFAIGPVTYARNRSLTPHESVAPLTPCAKHCSAALPEPVPVPARPAPTIVRGADAVWSAPISSSVCSPGATSSGIVTVELAAPPAFAVTPVASVRGVERISVRRPDSWAPNPTPLIVTSSPGRACDTESVAFAGSVGAPGVPVPGVPMVPPSPGAVDAAPTVNVTGSSAVPAG